MALFAASMALATATGAAPVGRREVTSLPGFINGGQQAKLPSRMFTGFIDAGVPPSGKGKMYFHYWMVQSEGDPSKDPVVMWYNGGPGASSLFGLLQELGPLMLNVDSYDENYNKTGIPSPVRNPFAWSKFATIIAIDSPPPIGFSYCTEEGPAGKGTSCGPWKDSTVFAANHEAHKTLFNVLFPELKPNPFYIAGESYAGIYVPGFANALMDDPIPGLNFKGFAVGDGLTGCEKKAGEPNDWCIDLDNVGVFKYPNARTGPWYDVEFFHGHSQFSEDLYREIRATCTEEQLRQTKQTPACQKLIDQMSEEVGGWFVYNLYNSCPVGELGAKHNKHGINKALRARRAAMAAAAGVASPMLGDAVGSSPCPGSAMPEWLGLNVTKKALGLAEDAAFVNLDNGHGFSYTSDQSIVTPIYQKALQKGLRVLVYEGDSDACGLQTAPVEDVFVPFFKKIGLNKTRNWRAWTTDGAQHMGGYVIEWENGNAQFASIRGSGHLVPLNRPEVSGSMLKNWIAGKLQPEYVAPPPPARQEL